MKTIEQITKKSKQLPFINYMHAFTDDIGIFQHSTYGVPNLHHGYTTDDNARALILAVLMYEVTPTKKLLRLITKYLAFLVYAQNDDGKFRNFMSFQRQFLEDVGSEDCIGRCVWALGRTLSSKAVPTNIKRSAMHAMNKVVEGWTPVTSPRTMALCLIGFQYVPHHKETKVLAKELASTLSTQYQSFRTEDWHWFEDSMTYGNALLPMSMLQAFNLTQKSSYLQIGTESMQFLEKQTMTPDYYKPIGTNGWLVKGQSAALYDEQPIEAGETTLAYLTLYNITHKKKYLNQAKKCLSWYTGQNSKALSLIDPETGACYDGLNAEGLNLNQGSECVIMYGIAYLSVATARDERRKS